MIERVGDANSSALHDRKAGRVDGRDPLHVRAREHWELLHQAGTRLFTSVPVIIETFIFLDRNANRDVALARKDAIYQGVP